MKINFMEVHFQFSTRQKHFRSDYFTRKNILRELKEHWAIFIRAHFIWAVA